MTIQLVALFAALIYFAADALIFWGSDFVEPTDSQVTPQCPPIAPTSI